MAGGSKNQGGLKKGGSKKTGGKKNSLGETKQLFGLYVDFLGLALVSPSCACQTCFDNSKGLAEARGQQQQNSIQIKRGVLKKKKVGVKKRWDGGQKKGGGRSKIGAQIK